MVMGGVNGDGRVTVCCFLHHKNIQIGRGFFFFLWRYV